ncbi:MAG TPA: hypothetical protein VKQ73_18315 [Stellaceae bacterium]|nr:hypothetical protein [Stellaceae bacterium]
MIDKYVQILNGLMERTDKGDLDWTETANKSAFLVSFPNYSIIFSEEQSQSGDLPDYLISIKNSEGRTVDSFSDVDLLSAEPGRKYFETMRDFFNKVRRKALRVDEALDDILSHLGERSKRS